MKKFGKKALALTAVAALSFSALTGCGNKVDNDAVVSTVGETEIKLGVANFYARYQECNLESLYQYYFGENFWGSIMAEDVTYEESTKDSIMEELQEYYLLAAHAEEYNVSITEEELAAFEDAADAFLNANKNDAKKLISADKETVVEYLRLVKLAERMKEAIIADVDTNVSDEEAAQKRLRYVRFATSVVATDDTVLDLTDEEKADVMDEATAFYKAATANGSLEAAAEEADLDSYTVTFDKDSTDIDPEVIEAADVLEEGAFAAEIIEAEGGYYVVQLESAFDEEATEAEKEDIVSTRENELYNSVVEEWREATEITLNEDVWAQVSFETLKVTAKED